MERLKTGGWRRHEIVRSLDTVRLMGVPKDPATAPISKELRSMLVDGGRRAGFLDYRAMLRTHLLSNPLPRSNRGPKLHDIIYGAESEGLEAQLFDLASLVILAGVRVDTAGGSQTTIGALMRKVWENRPPGRYKYQLASANSHANAFNLAFNAKLPELEAKLTEFLSYFENHRLAIKFQPVSLAWDKAKLELKGAELIPAITFRGQPVSDHHKFLNEARLSALATCLFLAGVHLSDNDYSNPVRIPLNLDTESTAKWTGIPRQSGRPRSEATRGFGFLL